MGDSLIVEVENENHFPSEPRRHTHSHENVTPTSSGVFQYEELMGGSIPCPSCMGSGRIPKERESELVALIPVNDKRLRPRKTCQWVSLGIAICLLTCGLLLFFLIPRSMSISSRSYGISHVNIAHNKTHNLIDIKFKAPFNVSNGNFYPVMATNATATILNRWNVPIADTVIGRGVNKTGVNIPIRKENEAIELDVEVQLKDPFMLQFCLMDFRYLYLEMQFDITATFEYMGHREQDTVSVIHTVCCCVKCKGNCIPTTDDYKPNREYAKLQ